MWARMSLLPHALELGVVGVGPGDLLVGRGDGAVELRGGLRGGEGVVVDLDELGDDGGRGDVPAGVTAHAVGDDEQVGAGVPGVLVVLADEPDVGARGVVEGQRHVSSSAR